MVRSEEKETLVQFIAKAGETMVRQREELITMMIKVDKEENEEDGGANRVKKIIKTQLESSLLLTYWLKSVDDKYPLPKIKKEYEQWVELFEKHSWCDNHGCVGHWNRWMVRVFNEKSF